MDRTVATPVSLPEHDDAIAARLVGEVRAKVDARLDAHLDAARARAADAGAGPRSLTDAIATLVRRGGKRLRPALTIAAARACVDADTATAIEHALIDGGCAWELLQAYLLIHDDWMDGDVVRRGGPAVHVALTRSLGGDAHVGASAAVLAGDLACAYAQRVLAEIQAPPRIVMEAAALFATVHEEVTLGQAVDLTLEPGDAAGVERMHALKTGSYSSRGPLLLGAVIADASSAQRAALIAFAEPIGVAFQLRDDLLGTFGSEIETGKSAGNDLRSRKRTALVVDALATLPRDEAQAFEAKMRATSLDDGDVAWMRERLITSGARARVEARIEALAASALVALAAVDAQDRPIFQADGVSALRGMARLLTRRVM